MIFCWTLHKFNYYTITQVVPEFLPNYRNPCWWEVLPWPSPYKHNFYMWHVPNQVVPAIRLANQKLTMQSMWGKKKRLRCLPYFYIIGFPKCGTTELFEVLQMHYRVANRVGMKAPMFWNRWRQGRVANADKILSEFSIKVMIFYYET